MSLSSPTSVRVSSRKTCPSRFDRPVLHLDDRTSLSRLSFSSHIDRTRRYSFSRSDPLDKGVGVADLGAPRRNGRPTIPARGQLFPSAAQKCGHDIRIEITKHDRRVMRRPSPGMPELMGVVPPFPNSVRSSGRLTPSTMVENVSALKFNRGRRPAITSVCRTGRPCTQPRATRDLQKDSRPLYAARPLRFKRVASRFVLGGVSRS